MNRHMQPPQCDLTCPGLHLAQGVVFSRRTTSTPRVQGAAVKGRNAMSQQPELPKIERLRALAPRLGEFPMHFDDQAVGAARSLWTSPLRISTLRASWNYEEQRFQRRHAPLGSTAILMIQTADLWNCNDSSAEGPFASSSSIKRTKRSRCTSFASRRTDHWGWTVDQMENPG